MRRSIALIAALCFALAATAADAQMGGGGGGGGHGRGNRSQDKSPPPSEDGKPPPEPRPPPPPPTETVEIVGVVRDVDAANGRITIAYEEVDALNWPAGTLPLEVAHTDLMKDVTVGEKVRFKIASQQIWAIEPYVEKPVYGRSVY